MAQIPYDEAPTTRFHALVALAAGGGQFSDGYILGTVGIALSLATVPLHLSALWLGLLGGASLAGIFLGSLFLAALADRLGRRPLFVTTMAVFAVLSVVQWFVTSLAQLLIVRLLLGLTLGIDYVVCCAAVAEFSPRRTRGRLLCVLVIAWASGYTSAFVIGTLFASSMPHAWRWILCSSAVPSALVFLIRLRIPESPPWLMQHGRQEAAREIIARHLGAHIALPVITPSPTRSLQETWAELLGPQYRRRTLVGAVFYTAQVIPYFALGTFIPVVLGALEIQDTYVGGVVFNAFVLLGAIIGLWLIDKITRRQLLIGGFYLASAILLFLVVARTPPMITVAIAALFAFVVAASSILQYAYLPELFPMRLRAAGVGIGTAASRIGSATSTFLLPICVGSIGIRPTLGICVSVLLIGGLICQAFAPETQGCSIEAH